MKRRFDESGVGERFLGVAVTRKENFSCALNWQRYFSCAWNPYSGSIFLGNTKVISLKLLFFLFSAFNTVILESYNAL